MSWKVFGGELKKSFIKLWQKIYKDHVKSRLFIALPFYLIQ